MSMSYIRRAYGVPAKRGARVESYTSKFVFAGRITSAKHYVYILFDDAKRPVPLHPREDGLRYLDGGRAEPRGNSSELPNSSPRARGEDA